MKKRLNSFNNEHGLTLVELLIALTLTSMILGLIYSLMFLNLRAFDQAQVSANEVLSANSILHRLGNEIRSAEKPEISGLNYNAVEIMAYNGVANRQLYIYGANGDTSLTVYRLVPETGGSTQYRLERGLSLTYTYPATFTTVLTGINILAGTKPFEDLFKENIAWADHADDERRLIRVHFEVKQSQKYPALVIDTQYLSRNRKTIGIVSS